MSDVIDLDAARRRRAVDEDLARGRRPLHVSHLDGMIRDTCRDGDDFSSRLVRIRASLEKINRLMAELKRMSAEGGEASR